MKKHYSTKSVLPRATCPERSRGKSRGFTLLELLVAVFVFMILFLIIMAFVRLASGQAKSLHTAALTTSLRHTMDTISLKMHNANGQDGDIYGFKVNGDRLGIANFDGTTTKCTFIKKKSDTVNGVTIGRIYMAVPNNCSWPGDTEFTQPITDSTVNVTSAPSAIFTAPSVITDPTNVTAAPYLKVNIIAEDVDPNFKADNKINLQTSYTMDYLTIKALTQ